MRRFVTWVRNLSIKRKLVFYSYAIIGPILLIISCLLFYRNYIRAIEVEEESNIQSVKNLSDSIEVLQNNVIEIATYISINNDINDILTSEVPERLNQDAQVWLNQAPMQMIEDMIALDGQIRTIAIYPENGVKPYLRCLDYSAYLPSLEMVRDQDIYRQVGAEKGKFLWQRVGKYASDTYQASRYDKIVTYRAIYDIPRQERLGYLVMGSAVDRFDDACSNALTHADESIVVMSSYGAELIRSGNLDAGLVDKILKKGYSRNLSKNGMYTTEYDNYRVYLCQSAVTGTITYKITPKAELADFVDTIIITPLVLLLGFLVALYPIMLLISNIVNKPLGKLIEAMEYFKRGNFSHKLDVNTKDELGAVAACFNSMVDNIRDLIDKNYVMALKERESELATLQAQINPHFLYNTLDSLYWRAIEAGDEDLAEDIISLSDLFRLVLNRGSGIVTVRTEMELLERYLHIQKMRFGKRLEYGFDIEGSILDEEIPKLILQPFVENAIVHGFEKGEKDYRLSVTGKREEKYMTFKVIDTGVGMNEEQLAAIWEQPDTKKYASQRIGKYAVKNVKERLELIYKSDYQLIVESKEGQGTTVTMSVPYGAREMRTHEHKAVDCG